LGKNLARLAIIACLGFATVAYGALEKRVTVRVDGVPVAVRTHASTVGDVLDRTGVEVGALDRVEPSLDDDLSSGDVIEVYRAKTIILLLDGKPRTIVVTGRTIADVIEEVRLRGWPLDTVRPALDTPVEEGMTIRYRHAVGVTVVHDGARDDVVTNATSVGQVLRDLGITLGARDKVEPKLTARPAQDMVIRVLRVGIRKELRTIEIPYDTVIRRDPSMEFGERKTIQDGRSGLKRIVYRARYVNGERVARAVVSTKVVREARTRIIAVGSGFPGCACNRGTQTGEATWYGQADGLTAAHRTLPFGTIVRVENLANGKWVNVRIVDRGPFADGRIIDLSDEAFRRIASLSTGVIRVRIRW